MSSDYGELIVSLDEWHSLLLGVLSSELGPTLLIVVLSECYFIKQAWH